MAKTVIGLFDTHNEAQNVVQALVDGGFSRDQISLIARDAQGGEYGTREVGDTADAAGDGAGAGAIGGTVLGGTLGLLIGTGLLVIPGIGPVLAAGPLAAAIGTTTAAVGATALGAGIGAATGGLVGGLVGAGVPDDDANYYAEGVRRGGTLVTVSADDTMADRAYSIFQSNGAINIRERGESWRGEGWNTFDPSGTPYRRSGETGDDWQDSSKVGTGTGVVSGAATGAAIGSAGGPVGTVIGGIAGAVVGGGVGAAGDVAGEQAEDMSDGTTTTRTTNQYSSTDTRYRSTDKDTGDDWQDSSKVGTGTGVVSGAATGAAIGSAGGPVGTVVGGIAGAVVGGGAGAAGDVAGERAEDMDDETYGTNRNTAYNDRATMTDTGRSDYAMGQREMPQSGAHSDFARGQRAFETYDDTFRTHYRDQINTPGRSYDEYSTAYRFGYDNSYEPTYSGQSWTQVEPDLRLRWERDRPNSWEQFKDSIRYAWESVQRGR